MSADVINLAEKRAEKKAAKRGRVGGPSETNIGDMVALIFMVGAIAWLYRQARALPSVVVKP